MKYLLYSNKWKHYEEITNEAYPLYVYPHFLWFVGGHRSIEMVNELVQGGIGVTLSLSLPSSPNELDRSLLLKGGRSWMDRTFSRWGGLFVSEKPISEWGEQKKTGDNLPKIWVKYDFRRGFGTNINTRSDRGSYKGPGLTRTEGLRTHEIGITIRGGAFIDFCLLLPSLAYHSLWLPRAVSIARSKGTKSLVRIGQGFLSFIS